MKGDGDAIGSDYPQPTDHRRRWFGPGAAAVLLACACLSMGRLIAAPRPQPPIDASLIEAVKRGDVAAAKRLLDQGANPNAREVVLSKPSLAEGSEGGKPTLDDTALLLAVQMRNTRLVRVLLHKGADVNGRGVAGFTALMEAVRQRDADLAKLLLVNRAKPDQRNDYGDTALVCAANEGLPSLVNLLLDSGADVNGGSRQTPLAMAVDVGWKDVVKLLLSRGADVNLRRAGYPTPLEIALLGPDEEITALIRKAGGRGRSVQTLRQESERVVKAFVAEQQAKSQRPSRDRILTDDDRQIIGTVLLDLLTEERSKVFLPGLAARPDIVLITTTPVRPGLALSDGQLNAELDTRKANDVTLAIRTHLAQRNGQALSLADFNAMSKHIVLDSEEALRAGFGFADKHPHARGWVQVYLPGYSESRDRAVLRFYLGPSFHGAAGTYFLLKQDSSWRVEWRDFAFYA